MRKFIISAVVFCFLCSAQMSFAAKGGEKGPSDRAYERANKNASFLRNEVKNTKKEAQEKKVKAEKKVKKEKKAKDEAEDKITEEMTNKVKAKKEKAEREMKMERERARESAEE